MNVVHVIGAMNEWALHKRARALVDAMKDRVNGSILPYRSVQPSSFRNADFVHIHGLQLVALTWKMAGGISCPWGFEVVSDRSLFHLHVIPVKERRFCSSALKSTGNLKYARVCWIKNPRLRASIEPFVCCPVVYVPNGVNPKVFHPGPIRVGWVGNKKLDRHKEYKGLPLIYEAVKLLDSQLECGCVFIPDPSDYPKVVPQTILAEYYRQLDVFVCASEAEGCSNVVNEALTCGVPVVSTRVGIAEELEAAGLPIYLVERTASGIAQGVTLAVSPMLRAYRTMSAQYGWVSAGVAGVYERSYKGDFGNAKELGVSSVCNCLRQ